MTTNIDLKELAECLELLQQVFGPEKTAFDWLDYPHPHLGKKPLVALAEGNTKAVLKILRDMSTKILS